MNYATLIASKSTAGSIANWLNHDSITASAPTIVEEAESLIYRRLRHFRMSKRATGSMTTNIDYVALPSDFIEDKILYITGVNQAFVVRKTPEEVVQQYFYDGSGNRVKNKPRFYCNDQTNLYLDAPPDQNYPYLFWYYAQPAPLSTTSTNFLTDHYQRLLRVACCVQAAEFMKDAGQGNYDRTYWLQQFEPELMRCQQESDRSERSTYGAAEVK